MTTVSPAPQRNAAEIIRHLLPPTTHIIGQISQYCSQIPNITLPIVDPLIPYVSNSSSATSSIFDIKGRSQAARYAETVLCYSRVDRQMASSQVGLLRIILAAKILAQDASAVPGASRRFFSPNVQTDVLSNFIREAEGALSYSLATFDESPPSWHESTTGLLRVEPPPVEADFLQCLLSALQLDVVRSKSDVSARVFRDILSRQLRQSGGGEAEADAWLTYAMSKVDKGKSFRIVG